jgi:hypothetical protein
MATAGSTP